ncbi:MAG: lysine transporter LysE [Flavobacteriaceae bacterium]
MTHLLLLFFSTFSAAFMASAPPGLLNLNAAKTRVRQGKTYAYMFGLGVMSAVIIQSGIAVWIARYVARNPELLRWMLWFAVGMFAVLAVYFFSAPTQKNPMEGINFKKQYSFWKGFGMALANMLTIPYYVGLHAMWRASGWIFFAPEDITVFMMAASLGTGFLLYLYIEFFQKLLADPNQIPRRFNHWLGALMVLLMLLAIYRLF